MIGSRRTNTLSRVCNAELVAICDADPETAARAGRRWGVPAFEDHRALIAAVRPDVVHVCTPMISTPPP